MVVYNWSVGSIVTNFNMVINVDINYYDSVPCKLCSNEKGYDYLSLVNKKEHLVRVVYVDKAVGSSANYVDFIIY